MIVAAADGTAGPRSPEDLRQANRRLVIRLAGIVAVAFAFGFALVPLYDVFCRITGLNGKTSVSPDRSGIDYERSGTVPRSRIDYQRLLSIEFTGTVMPGLPWEIEPLVSRLEVHPGEIHEVKFRVHNRSGRTLVGQAVPSVSPGLAARDFEKLDCFCFRQQTLAPGETKDLPLVFFVKPEVDRDVRTLTLAYAFFAAPDGQEPAPISPK